MHSVRLRNPASLNHLTHLVAVGDIYIEQVREQHIQLRKKVRNDYIEIKLKYWFQQIFDDSDAWQIRYS